MKKNMGNTDRGIRLLVAVGIGVLYFTGQISGVLGAAVGIIALVLAATSIVGYCPAYAPLRLSTRKPTESV